MCSIKTNMCLHDTPSCLDGSNKNTQYNNRKKYNRKKKRFSTIDSIPLNFQNFNLEDFCNKWMIDIVSERIQVSIDFPKTQSQMKSWLSKNKIFAKPHSRVPGVIVDNDNNLLFSFLHFIMSPGKVNFFYKAFFYSQDRFVDHPYHDVGYFVKRHAFNTLWTSTPCVSAFIEGITSFYKQSHINEKKVTIQKVYRPNSPPGVDPLTTKTTVTYVNGLRDISTARNSLFKKSEKYGSTRKGFSGRKQIFRRTRETPKGGIAPNVVCNTPEDCSLVGYFEELERYKQADEDRNDIGDVFADLQSQINGDGSTVDHPTFTREDVDLRSRWLKVPQVDELSQDNSEYVNSDDSDEESVGVEDLAYLIRDDSSNDKILFQMYEYPIGPQTLSEWLGSLSPSTYKFPDFAVLQITKQATAQEIDDKEQDIVSSLKQFMMRFCSSKVVMIAALGLFGISLYYRDRIKDYLGELIDNAPDNPAQAIRDWLEGVKAESVETLAKAAYKLMDACIILGTVAHFGFEVDPMKFNKGMRSRWENIIGERLSSWGTSWFCFFKGIMISIVDFVDFGWQFMHDGVIENKSTYTKWVHELMDLKKLISNVDNTHRGADLAISYQDFSSRLEVLMNNGKRFLEAGNRDPTFMRLYQEGLELKRELDRFKKGCGTRMMPIGMFIGGKSGTGKSTDSTDLCSIALKAFGVEPSPDDIWDCMDSNKHADGYSNQKAIAFDDAFAEYDNGRSEGGTTRLLLHLLNHTIVPLPQAEAHKKGEVTANNLVLVACGTNGFATVNGILVEPRALCRRFQIVAEKRMKPKFANARGGIDHMKYMGHTEDPCEWRWCWIKFPGGSLERDTSERGEWRDRVTFYREVKEICEAHVTMEKEAYERRTNFNLCTICNVPLSGCVHNPAYISHQKSMAVQQQYSGFQLGPDKPIEHYDNAVNKLAQPSNMVIAQSTSDVLEALGHTIQPQIFEWIVAGIAVGYIARKDIAWEIVKRWVKTILKALMLRAVVYAQELMHINFNDVVAMARLGEARELMKAYALGIAKDILPDWSQRTWILAGGLAVAYAVLKSFTAGAIFGFEETAKGSTDILRKDWNPPERGVFSRQSKSMAANQEALFARIAENTYILKRMTSKNTAGLLCCTVIWGSIVLINRHFFKGAKPDQQVLMQQEDKEQGIINAFTFLIQDMKQVKIVDVDFSLYSIAAVRPHKSILELFPIECVDFIGCKGVMLSRFHKSENGTAKGAITVTPIEVTGFADPPVFDGDKLIANNRPAIIVRSGWPGACGSVSILPAYGVIISVHYAGSPNLGFARLFIQSDFHVTSKLQFGDRFAASENYGEHFAIAPFTELDRRSSFNYMSGYGTVLKTYAMKSFTRKTAYRPTLLQSYLEDISGVVFKQPVFTRRLDDPYTDPFQINMRKLVKAKTFDETYLKRAVNSYWEHLNPQPRHCEPLDWHTAINGIPGHAFIKPLKKATSAGFPWFSSKSEVLEFDPEIDAWKLKPEHLEMLEEMEKIYLDSKILGMPFKMALKDAVVSEAELHARKLRAFSGCSMLMTILVRKYFMPLMHLLFGENYDRWRNSECMKGMNALDPDEWGALRQWLIAHGLDKIIAGDYISYDKNIVAIIMKAVFNMIIRYAAECEYSSDHLKIMTGIALDICFPVYMVKNDLIVIAGSNPSGWPWTTEMNDMVNSLLVRMTYYMSGHNEFNTNVNLGHVGDDNIMGVGNEFCGRDISKHMKALGQEYTDEDKKPITGDYKHIDDVTFLKRKFVPCGYQRAYAPLKMKSILKSIMWTDSTMPAHEHMETVIENAFRELEHHPEESFNYWFGVLMPYQYFSHRMLGWLNTKEDPNAGRVNVDWRHIKGSYGAKLEVRDLSLAKKSLRKIK